MPCLMNNRLKLFSSSLNDRVLVSVNPCFIPSDASETVEGRNAQGLYQPFYCF